jgi:hypothetical protein
MRGDLGLAKKHTKDFLPASHAEIRRYVCRTFRFVFCPSVVKWHQLKASRQLTVRHTAYPRFTSDQSRPVCCATASASATDVAKAGATRKSQNFSYISQTSLDSLKMVLIYPVATSASEQGAFSNYSAEPVIVLYFGQTNRAWTSSSSAVAQFGTNTRTSHVAAVSNALWRCNPERHRL